MKRKLFALAIAAAIALVVVPLAFAAAKPPAKGKPFLAQGTVVSVNNPTEGTLVVTVARGSHNMKALFTTPVTFTLAAGCHIFARTVGHHGKVHFKNTTLDKVTVGSKVNINGRLGRNDANEVVYFARHIVVKLAPTPIPTATAIPSAVAAF